MTVVIGTTMFVRVVRRFRLHVDHERDREDPTLMLELSPGLVQARLGKLRMEGRS